MLEGCYEEPGSLESVKRVNEVAEDNWRRYVSDEFSELQGHLMMYPLKVDVDGNVGSLPECESFPDLGGKIIGAHSATLPDILTT